MAGTSNLAETSCRLGAKIIKPGSALFIRPKFPWSESASKSASTNGRAGAGGPGSHSWEETAGEQRRERRGGTWPRGWLLKLVPFFLRTWTLLRLSRGNSDSLETSSLPSPRLPSPLPSLETLLDTSERSADTDVGRVCRSRACGATVEGTGGGRSKQELSSPASPGALQATGGVERGPGWGAELAGQEGSSV